LLFSENYSSGAVKNIQVDDVDGDHFKEAIFSVGSTLYVTYARNGTIKYSATLSATINSIAVGDVVGIGDKEVIVTAGCHVYVFLYNLTGWVDYTAPDYAYQLALGDVNGDNVTDIAFGCADSRIYVITGNGTKILEGEGDDAFSTVPAIADLNGDGIADVIAMSNEHTVYAFSFSGVLFERHISCYSLKSVGVADYDGDGKFDALAVCDESLFVITWDGIIHEIKSFPSGITTSPVFGDLGRDMNEIVLAYYRTVKTTFIDGLYYWQGGAGTFQSRIADDPDRDYLSNGDPAPGNPDADGDDLMDGQELFYGTNPLKADTDADGLTDGWEVQHGTNPLHNDTDSDGLTDGWEVQHGTNPHASDSDGDGMPDGWEIQYQLDPLRDDALEDPDHDGLSNIEEYHYGTDPLDWDTDDDGISDGMEHTAESNKESFIVMTDLLVGTLLVGAVGAIVVLAWYVWKKRKWIPLKA